MPRKSFVFCPVRMELIPKDEYVRIEDGPVAPMVMGDIAPYRSMIDGREITSRSRHREHLREHGCIEVGNEKMPPRRPEPPKGLKDEVIRAYHASVKGKRG